MSQVVEAEKIQAPWKNGDPFQEKVHAGFKNVPQIILLYIIFYII